MVKKDRTIKNRILLAVTGIPTLALIIYCCISDPKKMIPMVIGTIFLGFLLTLFISYLWHITGRDKSLTEDELEDYIDREIEKLKDSNHN